MFIHLSVYVPWDILDVTRLLRMLYVFALYYINMLMVRYYRFYTVVAYDICVMRIYMRDFMTASVSAFI